MRIRCLPLIQTHYKLKSGKVSVKNPLEIIRTGWNSSSHQGNQNHIGKISKAAPSEVQDTPYIV